MPKDHNPIVEIRGWWIDGIFRHISKGFYGYLNLKTNKGKVLEIEAIEVINGEPPKINSDLEIKTWWFNSIHTALRQKHTGVIEMTLRHGEIKKITVPRRYTKKEIESDEIALCH